MGVLLPKGVEGTSRVGKASKKTKKHESQIEKEVTKPVQELATKDVQKEVVPSKIGVLKRTKKPTHRPRHSPERPIIEEVPVEPFSSPKEGSILKIRKIRKPQLNRRGVKIRDVPAPVSPALKKRKSHEVVKKIQKKKKQLEDPLDEVVVETDFESGSDKSPIHHEVHGFGFSSPQRDFPTHGVNI
ncbi:unnamed protein product [Lactuca virosa]|uniref:Uncharacterized protein n=1 Tax=Lactuca virosa TaxID=75947 RepID=A0AAU9NKE0_9ASTR|nr:unnamed protein product [Lactuca virosa]